MPDTIDNLFVEIQGSVDKGAKAIEDYAKNVDKTFGKLAISAQSVTRTTEALERRIKSTARELNVFDKIVLKTNTLINNTGRAADYAMDVVGSFVTAIKELSKVFLGFGIIGSRVFKALNIEKYKQFRNYMIGLGVSTAKTTGAVSKLGMGMLRLLPLWVKWALGIGAVIVAYKTLRWAVDKAKNSFNELNIELAEKTQSLILMHQGALIELTKQYEKTKVELSVAQAAMLRDYDDAVRWFKTTSEELTLWWDLHSPWQYIKRKSKIAFADIGESIRSFFAEIPKTAEKMHGLQVFLAELPEKLDTISDSVAEADPIWQALWKRQEGAVKKTSSTFKEMGVVILSNIEDITWALKKVTKDIEEQIVVLTPYEILVRKLADAWRENVNVMGMLAFPSIPEPTEGIPSGFSASELAKLGLGKDKKKVSVFGDMSEVFAASASLMEAAASWNNAANNMKDASDIAKAAALTQQLAAVANSIAAIQIAIASHALAIASGALAAGSFNWVAFAAIVGMIAAIVGLVSTISGFKEGGFVSKGPGSLPEIPSAAQGMITPPNVPDSGMLVNVHGNEIIGNTEYIGRLIGVIAQRFLDSRPIPAVAGAGSGGNVTIVIQANKDFNSPSWWENLVKTSIRPALRNVNYGR